MNSITFHSGKVACRITKDTNNIRDCQISIESIILTIRMELSQFTKTQATWLRLKIAWVRISERSKGACCPYCWMVQGIENLRASSTDVFSKSQ